VLARIAFTVVVIAIVVWLLASGKPLGPARLTAIQA
jgi:hypothetical protein